MSNKLDKISAAFSTTKMKIFDWTLSILSLFIGLFLYFIHNSQDIAFWWILGGLFGVVFSIWRPIDKIQNFMQRAAINKSK